MWAVHACVVRVQPDGWVGVRTTPTFYLDPNVQGITSAEHARKIAQEIVGTFTRPEESITAIVVENVSAPYACQGYATCGQEDGQPVHAARCQEWNVAHGFQPVRPHQEVRA